MYTIRFVDSALKDLRLLQKHAPQAISKLNALLLEIAEHPRSGTGQAERLKHYEVETWSRRINKEHRIVYEIHDDEIVVLILSLYGHY